MLVAADRQATGVQQHTKDNQQQYWRSAQTLSMALQSLCVSSAENSPTEQITSLGLFIPFKDRLLGLYEMLGRAGMQHSSVQMHLKPDHLDNRVMRWDTESMQDAGEPVWHSLI